MGAHTGISWTDHTFNPWWGCERVSPGCQHCYAEAFAKRTGHAVWGKSSERRFFGDKHWAEPLKWNAAAERAGERARVFCASMADVFEDRRDLDEHRERLYDVIADTPWLDWQLLTKRPQNVLNLVPVCWDRPECHGGWPANVWIGTTVEDQTRANERVLALLDIHAPVRFLSCEPLLGELELSTPGWLDGTMPAYGFRRVDWVICGGESGTDHRPLNLDHARSLCDQCVAAGVPFFFKQVGGNTPTAGGDLLDGERWHQFPQVAALASPVASRAVAPGASLPPAVPGACSQTEGL